MMLPEDVALQSIEFKTLDYAISSVRCKLSDGTTSPVFESTEVDHENHQNLQLNTGQSIIAVSASHDCST